MTAYKGIGKHSSSQSPAINFDRSVVSLRNSHGKPFLDYKIISKNGSFLKRESAIFENGRSSFIESVHVDKSKC